jgi:hypothetical protein
LNSQQQVWLMLDNRAALGSFGSSTGRMTTQDLILTTDLFHGKHIKYTRGLINGNKMEECILPTSGV